MTTINLNDQIKMTSYNMSKKESKAELIKKIRKELFLKKNDIAGKTYTALREKIDTLEFGKKNNLKSLENFYKEKVAPLNKEINTKGKLQEKNKQVKADTNAFFNAVDSSGLIQPTSKKSKDERKKARDEEIKKTNALISSLSSQLSSEMWIINTPVNYSHCLGAVNACPVIKSQLEKKIKTYYIYNVSSLNFIISKLSGIYSTQKKIFKVSVSLGFVYELKGSDSKGKPFYTYNTSRPSNSKLLLSAELVKNKKMLMDNVLNKLTEENIIDYLDKQRPTSAHKIIGVNAVMIRIYGMEHNIGASIPLPDLLAKSHSIINPESSYNMCFWNCMAYNQIKNKRCATLGKELYTAFYGTTPQKDYKGFDYINEIDKYEDFSGYAINIYDYDEGEKKLNFIRKSIKEENTVDLLLYINHFVYIKSLEVFNGCKYGCSKCGLNCDDIKDLKKHIKFCDNFEKVDVFCKYPQVYEPERNIIISMNEIFDCQCDFKYKPLIVYDFESLVLKFNCNPTDNLKLPTYQQAVSVSLYSNILGFENEIFIENEDPKILFNEMFKHLDSMCKGAVMEMKAQLNDLYEKVEAITSKTKKKYYLNKLDQYVEEVPIIGFNSGRYDINLNISEFMAELVERNGDKIFSVKNGNTFKTLKSGNFAFYDICQYLPAGYNLDQYIQAFNKGGLKKSVFPYEYMDSYEKLNSDINLIERKHFFSTLKNCGITDDEWKEFNDNRIIYQWKTLKDLLRFYNNLDVRPFLEAVINNQKFYYPLQLEMFKDGLSLPALSEKIMFQFQFKEFNNDFIHKTIPKTKYELLTNWRERFKGYVEQDKETERYEKKHFITYMELNGLMEKQSNKCLYCWECLTNNNWSLDRINNDFGHNGDNCVLSCVNCNTQRSDEYFAVFYRKKALLRYSKVRPLIYLIDEENKDVFYLLKNNICGGPSIVFHRYHEAGVTKIKRPVYENGEWRIGEEGKSVKNITGFDANALYLGCIGEDMPCGRLKYKEFEEEITVKFNMNDFINKTDGFILVDIHTKEEDFNKFGEFPLIFKNVEYDINEQVGDYMNNVFNRFDDKKKRMTRKLISSFKGEKVLIKSTRLRWLIKQGLVVSKIHGFIKCKFANIFKDFTDWVSDERRKGDTDPDYEIKASMAKNVGNSAFGRTGMNKSKFNKTSYGDEYLYNKKVCTNLFKDANQYGDVFEVSCEKQKTRQNIPIQIACSIYDDAKLKMSEFYYDVVDKYISRDDFQYIEMDTDSAYMALTDDFFKLIKPEMNEEFEQDKNKWFPRDDTKENKAFDKRKPCLFKEEFIGKGIVALSSKLYYVKGFDKKDKMSAKGIQLKHNADIMNYETYKNVVLKKEMFMANAKGMRIFNDKQIYKEKSDVNQNRKIYNYETVKIGLTEKYDKRIVLEDGLSTVPLNI